MTDIYYDDENYNDGFDEDSHKHGMNLELWRRLLGYATAYRFEVGMLFTSATLTAAAEIAFPLLTRGVIDEISTRGTDANLLIYGAWYAFFTVLLAFSVLGFIWFGGRLRTHVAHDIRMDGFKNLQRLSFSYYDYRPVGWLMARMTSDCERLSNILAWGMLDLVWGSTMMLGIAVSMLFMDVSLALIVLSVLPFLAWISIKFQQRILHSARLVRKTNSRITGSYNESIVGVQTSKAFVKEAQNLYKFGELTNQMHRASVTNLVQAALYLPIVLTLGSFAIGLALVFGGVELIWGAITAGTLVAFLTYARHFFEPIEQLAHWFAEMQMAQASAERIMSLIQAEPDIQDSPEVIRRIEKAKNTHMAVDGLPDNIQKIQFHDVGFRYDVGDDILRHIDLTINQGETLAIVGSTGGGKSTLISLLCRFYEPTSGHIKIDGIDYRKRSLHWLQSNLGIVLQTSHIFSGSIMENIRYGKLGASDNEVVAASIRAGAHSFVEKMPSRYSTSVGEGGSNLSAGQKQLISFARAILSDPKILVMDEATSSVDTETEQQIQKGMGRLLSDRISVVIAHRLSTILNADRILVIEDGGIIEQGRHSELIALGGRYHKLYAQQSIVEFSRTEQNWQA